MADYDLIIIGGGLSGLASGIRFSRFGGKVLILEQHFRPGGLNSYYKRQGYLLETGLHAMTNYAPPQEKHAPLNRLFRQLKLPRKKFSTHQQICSEINFPDQQLLFSNNRQLLIDQIAEKFPDCLDKFIGLIQKVSDFDAFLPRPWQSARAFLQAEIGNHQLEDMLLLPLMIYGNSEEHDMDLGQFIIMFQSIFLEGFFRPPETIKEFIAMLTDQYEKFGGEIRYRTSVASLVNIDSEVKAVRLENGEEISCDKVLSTIGTPGTASLIDWPINKDDYQGQLSFMESIFILPIETRPKITNDKTIIFYNSRPEFSYCRPVKAIDDSWGVICFPENFQGVKQGPEFQLRISNTANYQVWLDNPRGNYEQLKKESVEQASAVVSKIIGNFQENIVYHDCFTPLTIVRYTAKQAGAVYGSPVKIKDGRTPYGNLFIAGTDQGFLGIVGSMLSGVTIVNQHLLQ